MSEKYKKTYKYSSCIKHLVILASIYAFASLVAISVGIKSSALGIKSFAIIAGIKKYKSVIKKKKKKHDKIVLLAKSKLNSVILIHISHDEFVSVNNVLREYYKMKEEIKNPETSVEHTTKKQWKPILAVVKDILLIKIQVSEKLIKID